MYNVHVYYVDTRFAAPRTPYRGIQTGLKRGTAVLLYMNVVTDSASSPNPHCHGTQSCAEGLAINRDYTFVEIAALTL